MVDLRKTSRTGVNRLTVALSIVVYLLSFFSAANASVVCVGSDGHVAVESVHTGPCNRSIDKNLMKQDSLKAQSLDKDSESSILELSIASKACTDTVLPFNTLNKGFISSDLFDFEFDIDQPKPLINPLTFPKSFDRALSQKENPPGSSKLNILKTIILTI